MHSPTCLLISPSPLYPLYRLSYNTSFDSDKAYLDVDGGQGVGGGGAVVQHGVVQVAENVLQEEKKEE